MEQLISMITNSGVSIVVIGYFMYRDYKFIGTLQQTLQTLVDTTNCLKDIIAHKTNVDFE